MNPAVKAAIMPPREALAILLKPYFLSSSLIISNRGSCTAEKRISRVKVGARPV